MVFGIIHATTGSVAPLKNAILSLAPDAKILNFVNEQMLRYVNQVSGVDAKAMRMFAAEVFVAEEAGVEAIMIACNVYAPRLEQIKPLVSVTILAVDSAMQEKAAKLGGKIGVMGTNGSAVPSWHKKIRSKPNRVC